MDQVISGLQDTQIKTDVLSNEQVPKWGLQDLVVFVESKEAGKVSASLMGGHNLAGEVSGGRRTKPPGRDSKESCRSCGRKPHGPGKLFPSVNLESYICGKTRHLTVVCFKNKKAEDKKPQKA